MRTFFTHATLVDTSVTKAVLLLSVKNVFSFPFAGWIRQEADAETGTSALAFIYGDRDAHEDDDEGDAMTFF